MVWSMPYHLLNILNSTAAWTYYKELKWLSYLTKPEMSINILFIDYFRYITQILTLENNFLLFQKANETWKTCFMI